MLNRADWNAERMHSFLEREDLRGLRFVNPVNTLKIDANTLDFGFKVSFKVTGDLATVKQLALLRSFSKDEGSATVVQTYDPKALTDGDTVAYGDSDKDLVGADVWYWVRVRPTSDQFSDELVGPVTSKAHNTDTAPPSTLLGFDASKSAGAGGLVNIVCSYKLPNETRARGVRVYIAGYKGIAADVLIADSLYSPFQFTLEQTGEAVTLKAYTLSQVGIESAAALTKALTLDGTATVPTKIQDGKATEISTGVQIEFTAGLEPASYLTYYTIARGPRGGGYGPAVSIGTVAHSPGKRLSLLDGTGLSGDFEYYIVGVSFGGSGTVSDAITTTKLLTSADVPTNVPSNQTNNATVDSVDAGSSATIRVYGPGGVGSGYTRTTGYGTQSRSATSITGKSYSTTYYIYWTGSAYIATTSFFDVIPDGYEYVGKTTTVASGGSGGTSGGGGGAGIGGCVETGTPVEVPEGTTCELEWCEEWSHLRTPEGILSMHPDTLVSVFKKARDLEVDDLVEIRNGMVMKLHERPQLRRYANWKEKRKCPGGVYFARGVRLHNMKPNGN